MNQDEKDVETAKEVIGKLTLFLKPLPIGILLRDILEALTQARNEGIAGEKKRGDKLMEELNNLKKNTNG